MKIITDLSITSAPHRARHDWHPGLLFRSGAQGAWFDPSDLTTLFQDAAGTIPVASDGNPVALMLDKSGNGNHATQPVAAARPTWRSDGNLAWLEFDGVDDSMSVAGVALTNPELSLCTGLSYAPFRNEWGALRSRTEIGMYVGLSHPTHSGSISFAGGQTFVNGAPAPNNRAELRNLQTTPAVGRVESAQASAFSGHPWQFVSYWSSPPPPARLYAYVEVNAPLADHVAMVECWVAGKTGVVL